MTFLHITAFVSMVKTLYVISPSEDMNDRYLIWRDVNYSILHLQEQHRLFDGGAFAAKFALEFFDCRK